MPAKPALSNKAKIARRVVEVLEYFDDINREATVMDLVRCLNRPQSSTSELVHALVEMGLLYKAPGSRAYSLSPRAALLGTSGQPRLLRDGHLVGLMDHLLAQTGLAVALLGIVGLDAQVLAWRPGLREREEFARPPCSGSKEPLLRAAAGLLMLSALDPTRCEGLVRRMNAEAAEGAKFRQGEVMASIEDCRHRGYSHGLAGFGTGLRALSCLLPQQPMGQPMAVCLAYGEAEDVDPGRLLKVLNDAIGMFVPERHANAIVGRFANVA